MTPFAKITVSVVVGVALALVAASLAGTSAENQPESTPPEHPARLRVVSEANPPPPEAHAPPAAPFGGGNTPPTTTPFRGSPPASAEPKPAATPAAPAAHTEPPAAQTAQSTTEHVRSAVVNIECTTGSGISESAISASGVFIDPRGVILTNAHVAQYFLLANYPTLGSESCVIRTGSPAVPRYTAEPLFVPPSWVSQNAANVSSPNPTGKGEHDYALLLVTGAINGEPLPASFPYLSMSAELPSSGSQTILAAYPAGFLGGVTIVNDLYESSAVASVGDLYTFGANTLDLFSAGGTVLSQHGSSGGAAADMNGSLIGLIVTATEGATTAARDLRALSMSYLARDFASETGGVSLSAYLSGDLFVKAATFNANTAPGLTAELAKVLYGQ